MIGKVAFGILVAVCVMIVSPVSGVLMLGAVALFLFRWPRAPFIAYAGAMIAVAAGLWIVVEILDEADIPALFPSPTPTPTIQRAFATPTRPIATPNLAPAQQTATATAVVGQNVARISRARARWLRGDYAAARAELDAALTAMPGQPASHNLRALVRIAAGDVQGGVADAEAAVTASSQAIFRDTRAYAYLKVGRYDDAAADYDRILSGPSTESHTANYLGRGIARSAQGKLVEARADLETGLRLLPDTPPDPQLADLEMLARQALDPMAPRPGTPTPIPSPGAQPAATPAASPVTPPVAPPVASPVALRGDASLPGRAP
jgi:tetratricopeptide (TPR) repeat protein